MIEQQETYYAYTGNGVTTQFAYGCRIFTAADLVVTVAGIVKALGVDYTITGVDDIGGGEIAFVPASVPVNGVSVELERVLSYTRGTSYVQNGGFQPEIVDKDQDYQTALVQQIEARAVLFPSAGKQDRAGMMVGFDPSGNPVPVTLPTPVILAEGAATVIAVDAGAAPGNVNLPETGDVTVIKTDASANAVTVTATGGKTILHQAAIDLTGQDESIRVFMIGANWYQI